MEYTIMENTNMENTNMENTTIENTTIENTIVDTTNVDTTNVDTTNVDTTNDIPIYKTDIILHFNENCINEFNMNIFNNNKPLLTASGNIDCTGQNPPKQSYCAIICTYIITLFTGIYLILLIPYDICKRLYKFVTYPFKWLYRKCF